MKTVGKILTAFFFIFGVLFTLAAFSSKQANQGGTLITGIILLIICAVLGFFSFRKAAAPASDDQNITYKIDLPANVNMDTLKCKSCGGAITPADIAMVAGAPVVTCPFCHTSYQLTEDPKW
jgi:hypothetical protein